jgi:hypothetical protein
MRCIDVGTRTIAAVKLNVLRQDCGEGPFHVVAEFARDEGDRQGFFSNAGIPQIVLS